jgi:hypothetical protein
VLSRFFNGPEHQFLARGQLMANSEADKRVDPVHIAAAGNRAVARHHDTIEVQAACQVEFQGYVLVPVSGPRQQIDGGAALEDVGILDAATGTGAPSGNLVSGTSSMMVCLKSTSASAPTVSPQNGSGDTAVDAEPGIEDMGCRGREAPAAPRHSSSTALHRDARGP